MTPFDLIPHMHHTFHNVESIDFEDRTDDMGWHNITIRYQNGVTVHMTVHMLCTARRNNNPCDEYCVEACRVELGEDE